jgi:hypothetical protein
MVRIGRNQLAAAHVSIRRREITGEARMDAKYNHIIDSMKWRILLNVTGFVVWLAASAALLRVAS